MAYNALNDPFRKHEPVLKKGGFPERFGVQSAGTVFGEGAMFIAGGQKSPVDDDEKEEEKQKAEKDTMAAEIRKRKEAREAKQKADEEAAIAAGEKKRKKTPKKKPARRRAPALADEEPPSTRRNDVWVSRNGGDLWECLTDEAEWQPRSGHALLALGPAAARGGGAIVAAGADGGQLAAKQKPGSAPALFIIGGAVDAKPGLPAELCDVWRSEDGAAWTEVTRKAPFGGRALFGAATHLGMLYVAGGVGARCAMLQDVWRSPDGDAWQCMTEGVDVPWAARASHGLVVADGTLFLLGGYDASGALYADVWRSMDGKHWRHVCDAPWAPRCMAAVVAHDADIYVMGGWGAEGKLGDVWVSRDLGKTWQQLSHPAMGAEWSRRADFAALCHDGGAMFVIAGLNSSGSSRSMGAALQDVWRSEDLAISWQRLDTKLMLRRRI